MTDKNLRSNLQNYVFIVLFYQFTMNQSPVIICFWSLLDPAVDTRNVKHAIVMLCQLWEFIELLRNFRFTFSQQVVEDVEENDVSIGQLKKKDKTRMSKVRAQFLMSSLVTLVLRVFLPITSGREASDPAKIRFEVRTNHTPG